MRKFLVSCFLITAFSFAVHADTIILHNGKTVKADKFSIRDSKVVLPDGTKINISEIKALNFLGERRGDSGVKNVYASKDVREILAMADKAEKMFPGVKAVHLVDHGTNTYNADGTQAYQYHFVGRILNESMMHWADNTFWIDPNKNSVEIIMARSISRDGKVSYLDKKNIRTTSPSSDKDPTIFGEQNYKLKTYTIPNVEVGSVVEYIFKMEMFNTYDKNQWYPSWYFGDEETPVVDSTFEIVIPKDRELNWITKNLPEKNSKPKITEDGKTRHYVWNMKNVLPILKEPDSPPVSEFLPRVKCSLFKDMDYLHAWLGKMISRRIILTDELKKFTLELTKDAKTDDEKMAKIYHFIQQQIRYISIKGSISSSLAGHEAWHTFKNKYGDCIDKAILFSAMLQAVNIKAYPVVVKTNDAPKSLTPEIPVLDGNHAITEVHHGGRVFYLDTTATNYRYPHFRDDDQNIYAWNPILKQINYIKVVPPEYNMRDVSASMELGYEGNASMKQLIKYNGSMESSYRYWFKLLKPEQFKQWLQGVINNQHPGSTLKDYRTGDPTNLEKQLDLMMDYTMQGAAKRAGNLLIMQLPVYYDKSGLTLQKRKYPLKYRSSGGKKTVLKIKLPDGFKIRFVPKAISFKNKYASFESKFTESGNELTFEGTFKRYLTIVPPEDYASYKADIQKMLDFIEQPVILERK